MSLVTYSLRVVISHLESRGLQHKISSGGGAIHGFYEHGCKVLLPNDYMLSVQTHPKIAGPAFAETALFRNNRMVWFHHSDVTRHHTPDDLFDHIALAEERANQPGPDNSDDEEE